MGRRDLSGDDLHALLDFADLALREGWSDQRPSRLLEPLTELVPCDFVTLTVVANEPNRTASWAHPGDAMPAELLAAFDRHSDQHPYIRHHAETGRTGVARISDFVSERQWRNTALYTEHFRPLSARHQLCALLGVRGGSLVGLAFSRSRAEFSDRDLDVVEVAQSYLAAAYLRHEADTERERLAPAIQYGVAGPPFADALSRRQQQIVELIAAGLPNKQIATRLGIGLRTVHKHVEHILRKTGAANRTALAARYPQLRDPTQ